MLKSAKGIPGASEFRWAALFASLHHVTPGGSDGTPLYRLASLAFVSGPANRPAFSRPTEITLAGKEGCGGDRSVRQTFVGDHLAHATCDLIRMSTPLPVRVGRALAHQASQGLTRSAQIGLTYLQDPPLAQDGSL